MSEQNETFEIPARGRPKKKETACVDQKGFLQEKYFAQKHDKNYVANSFLEYYNDKDLKINNFAGHKNIHENGYEKNKFIEHEMFGDSKTKQRLHQQTDHKQPMYNMPIFGQINSQDVQQSNNFIDKSTQQNNNFANENVADENVQQNKDVANENAQQNNNFIDKGAQQSNNYTNSATQQSNHYTNSATQQSNQYNNSTTQQSNNYKNAITQQSNNYTNAITQQSNQYTNSATQQNNETHNINMFTNNDNTNFCKSKAFETNNLSQGMPYKQNQLHNTNIFKNQLENNYTKHRSNDIYNTNTHDKNINNKNTYKQIHNNFDNKINNHTMNNQDYYNKIMFDQQMYKQTHKNYRNMHSNLHNQQNISRMQGYNPNTYRQYNLTNDEMKKREIEAYNAFIMQKKMMMHNTRNYNNDRSNTNLYKANNFAINKMEFAQNQEPTMKYDREVTNNFQTMNNELYNSNLFKNDNIICEKNSNINDQYNIEMHKQEDVFINDIGIKKVEPFNPIIYNDEVVFDTHIEDNTKELYNPNIFKKETILRKQMENACAEMYSPSVFKQDIDQVKHKDMSSKKNNTTDIKKQADEDDKINYTKLYDIFPKKVIEKNKNLLNQQNGYRKHTEMQNNLDLGMMNEQNDGIIDQAHSAFEPKEVTTYINPNGRKHHSADSNLYSHNNINKDIAMNVYNQPEHNLFPGNLPRGHFMNNNPWLHRKKRRNTQHIWQNVKETSFKQNYLNNNMDNFMLDRDVTPSEKSSVHYIKGNKLYIGSFKKQTNQPEKPTINHTILPLFLSNSSVYDNGMSSDEFNRIVSAFNEKTSKLDYENVTVQQLKVVMKEFGLNHTGKKQELIERVKKTAQKIQERQNYYSNNTGNYNSTSLLPTNIDKVTLQNPKNESFTTMLNAYKRDKTKMQDKTQIGEFNQFGSFDTVNYDNLFF
ncbi:hypothetical protein BDAP_000984 [Binucleata daphniae]